MKEMKRIFAPTRGPQTWRRFVAKPKTQWKDGYSAKELAASWEKAWDEHGDFPPEVRRVFASYGPPFAESLELVLAIPEYQVKLPPEGRRPSCNDLFVLATTGSELAVIMVEGKVSEPFGDMMVKWRSNQSEGKVEREAALKRVLGITREVGDKLRYQLLHRTASAVIEAKRFGAPYAVMLVHSFSHRNESLEDYRMFFSELYGVAGVVGELVKVSDVNGVSLYCGWVRGV
jgi:hypothetical protein